MPMDSEIVGALSGVGADVDANRQLLVALPQNSDRAGYIMLSGSLSDTDAPAGLVTEPLRVSAQGRLTVGQPVLLLNEIFNYTAVNTAIFGQASTTQTITVGGGTLNLNASAITTLSTYCRVSTYSFFPFQADFSTFATFDAALSTNPLSNCTIEMGFMQAATNAAPTDGAFFRYDSAGTLKAVCNNNGVELTSAALNAPSSGVMHKYKIVCENDRVLFYIDGVCQAIINAPTALGMPMYAQGQPWMARVIHGGVAPALANVLKIGYLFVGLQDAAGAGKTNTMIAAISGRAGSQGQSGQTMGSTALLTNSLAAGAGAAMTNTTAALGTGLGGQFSALPTLAVGTDGVVCSYQNPSATAAIPGKTLYIRGVRVHGMVSTVLAGGPVLYSYSLAYGHTNVSLATTEAAGAKAPRRIPIGYETFAAAAAVGVVGSPGGLYLPLTAEIALNPGEFVALVAKNLGVVTTTGVITFQVSFDAYWD